MKDHDKRQDEQIAKVIRNRKNNSYAIAVIFLFTITIGVFLYKEYTRIQEIKTVKSEIAQLIEDESLRRCAYSDSLGKATIGFGHLLYKGDPIYRQKVKGLLCITSRQAVHLLRADYISARSSVDKNYPWATAEVKLVLTNMTYQLGETGVSKFKITLDDLKNEDYDSATGELLDSKWAKQTPNRALRLAGRIMQLN